MDRFAMHLRQYLFFPLLVMMAALLGVMSPNALANAGTLSGTLYDPLGNPIIDCAPSNGCSMGVDVYPWDNTLGQYADYPLTGTAIAADGSYRLELPFGQYKVVAVDLSLSQTFSPAMQEIQLDADSSIAIAEFRIAIPGVTGQIELPAGYSACDPYGYCAINVDAYPWDAALGRYADYPISGAPMQSDGHYFLELPLGQYKVVATDFYQNLTFFPPMLEVQLTPESTNASANFSASFMGVTGQFDLPPGYTPCDAFGNCSLGVEIYAWDSSLGQYADHPFTGAPVNPDGSYQLDLPYDRYKVVAVDFTLALQFIPPMQEVQLTPDSGLAVANFSAAPLGISGQFGLPPGYAPCDAYGTCNLGVEIYAWDSSLGQYADHPFTSAPVNPDGSYRLELPLGQYKVVAVDFALALHFIPPMQEVQLTPDSGPVVANFSAAPLGISGQFDLPPGYAPCDPFGTCSLGVEIYAWDSSLGQYADHPFTGAPVAPDGSYRLELPLGQYKVVAVDFTLALHFIPAMQEVQLTPDSGPVVANFSAAPMGISGQFDLPSGYAPCDPFGNCALGVEIYAWDSSLGQYADHPFTGAPVAPDGSYRLDLPHGRYQVAAVDFNLALHFIPAMQEVQLTPETPVAVANFTAALPGISGQLSIDPRDAGSHSFCDASGACRFWVELYQRDPVSGNYAATPSAFQQVDSQGHYAIDAPLGEYKVVAVDSWGQLAFTPAAVTGLILSPEQGTAVADFTAARPRISGVVSAPPEVPGFNYCVSAIDCRLVIETYAYNSTTGDYETTPVAVTSVGSDGRFEVALPLGTYRLRAIDTAGELEFLPAQIDNLLLDGFQANLTGLMFQAVQPAPALYVQAIEMSVKVTKRSWHTTAVVTVVDPQGNPLPDAVVQITWSGVVQGEESAATQSRRKSFGQVSFDSPEAKAGGSITFRITAISHPAYPYNARLNLQTEATVTIP